ncbi:Small nuclear RNA activating complex, polypeptide 1, 43kDa [Desmophyllum pertusum]|uniref:Small nuclear RNA activating complex, polypeptide 1, 43kDa n=1 Tax=Desmophyllum pertusum TaxID=174260 RepID=A0A9X0A2D6_9CNID|nr:Small nuclear RNA activating complex, polypeptide 1, 43kDa [Desmophyllum pertusum]
MSKFSGEGMRWGKIEHTGLADVVQTNAQALYFKGIFISKLLLKIRMTLTMMKDLKELHKQISEQQHHDADYILRLLHNEKAFLFVAMPIPLFYGSREAITSQEEGQSSVLIDDVNDNVEERFRALEYLEEAHGNYKEMKSKLQETATVSSDRSLNAISDDLVSDVACELQKFDDWKRTRCQKHVLEKKNWETHIITRGLSSTTSRK